MIATASRSKRKFVEGFGAGEVIDYATADFTDTLRDIGIVLDTVGGDTVERSLKVLRPGGHLVTAVAEDSGLAATYGAAGIPFSGIAVAPSGSPRGPVKPVEQVRLQVQKTFPFEHVTDAHQLLDGGHLQGKLVLTV